MVKNCTQGQENADAEHLPLAGGMLVKAAVAAVSSWQDAVLHSNKSSKEKLKEACKPLKYDFLSNCS